MSGVKISALPAATSANDSDQLEVNQAGTTRRITVDQIAELVQSAIAVADNVAQWGASPSASATANAAAFNAAISEISAAGGGVLLVGAGTYRINATIIMRSGVHMKGEGPGVTFIKLADGSNCDMIRTVNYDAAKLDVSVGPYDFGIEDLTLNGNYMEFKWNVEPNTIKNSLGYGIKCAATNFDIGGTMGVEITNIAEVGLRLAGDGSAPEGQDHYARVKMFGADFGKEGVIITGHGDFEIDTMWVGGAGLVPMPGAATTAVTSIEYPGEQVDGVVFDGVNLEVRLMHIYACWQGVGLRTRNGVRLEGDHIISESNNGQVWLSSGTYGAVSTISLRNLGYYYPSWTGGMIPVYSSPNPRWDAMTVESAGAASFSCGNIKIYRTSTGGANRVVGTNGLVVSGNFNSFQGTYNATLRAGSDPEVGTPFSLMAGSPVLITGDGNRVDFVSNRVLGEGLVIAASATGNRVGYTCSGSAGFGIQALGSSNVIAASISGQALNGSVGAALHNAASFNTWSYNVLLSTAPAFQSATGLDRGSFTGIYNGGQRSFVVPTISKTITVTNFDNHVTLTNEGSAATGELTTVNGGYAGQTLLLRAAVSGQDVTVKDATGNIQLSGDFILSHPADTLVVRWDGAASWCEVSRADVTA